MSTITTHRRALLAMAGATAALATAFTPSAANAAPEAGTPVDGREPSVDAGLGAAAQAKPTADRQLVQAVRPQQLSVPAQQAGALVSCNGTARIDGDRANNTYKVSGTLGCNANGYLRMRCKPVHRHSTYWHSHAWAFDVTRFGSSLSQSSGPINGTNGDTYKANCQYFFNGVHIGTIESGTITL
ncbi:MAG TPA: hypothetical protein VFR67_24625 [Pilimelia sp.]|nr:hypothetical protein [Pilimelia sp.]